MPIVFAPWLVVLWEACAGAVVRVATIRGMSLVVGQAAVAGWAISSPSTLASCRDWFYELVSSYLLKFCGLNVDRSDPFSDKSLCNALHEKTGIAFRTVKDRESMREDVEHFAMAKLEEKTGLHIRNIRDMEKTKVDLFRFASPMVSEWTGVPIKDLSDVEKTKADVLNYLQDRALVVLSNDIERAKAMVRDVLDSAGVSLEGLVTRIQKKGGIDPVTGLPNVRVDATMIVLGILARALLKAEQRRKAEADELHKKSRRQMQVSAAVKRFRERHGNRMTYNRV